MEKLLFEIEVKASASRAYNIMLGIDDILTYEQWTAIFNPNSTCEGRWEKGSKMLFIGTDETGKRGGIVSEIFELRQNEYVSIRHYGLLNGDSEVTQGEQVEKWSGGFENYSFYEKGSSTTIAIEVDVPEDHITYFTEYWPKALEKLKEIIEVEIHG